MTESPRSAGPDELRGASPDLVRRARDERDPLPGTGGFAGSLDASLVRDVLGRELVYREGGDDPVDSWAFDPDELRDPELLPAGCVRPHTVDADPTDRDERDWSVPDRDDRVWTLPEPDPETDNTRAVRAVREAVRESVDEVATAGVESGEDGGLAVAFSGGVDSAAVAARLDAPLYVAGFPESHDVEAARSAAAAMGRDLREVELTHADIERAVPEVVRATGRTNTMDVSIALSLYLVAERVAADGYDRLAVGQGADELFGGYAKVANAPDDERVDAETVRGARREVVATLPDQLERDLRTLRGAGVEPVAPLLHDRVVAAALALPGPLLVAEGGERKVAFRRAVAEWVPDAVASRDKKAVQYGSLVSRELDRLARQAGFKRRMDDHVGKYVESLVGDGETTPPGGV
jgi:asparagine synthase (glutamine-hydrolysing)